MNTNWKKNLKHYKKIYKSNSDYSLYKKTFYNKQIRFILIKLYSIFSNQNKDIELIINKEYDLIKNISNIEFWEQTIVSISSYFTIEFQNLDWNNFGLFLFYVYQISEFHNKKSFIKNIYNYENYNELNEIKANHYNKWLKSFYDQKISNFNDYVLMVLEIVK